MAPFALLGEWRHCSIRVGAAPILIETATPCRNDAELLFEISIPLEYPAGISTS